MGNFFTSTQIYNTKQLDREQFISFFCEEMKKNGYVPGNSDESEVSYIFRFADDCKWVTITSEDYDEGNQLSQTDTSRLAKMLKTTCINTTVIDSDCAVMEMYNKSGQKDDTLIMGRADDYFGDEITQPSMKAWKPFLAEGRSWEQFCDIVQDSESYTFIEDGLSELATVIGMDESEILFHSSVAEEDEQTVFLYFTKAAAKEKKISFIAAFKQVFGEMLEPLGYKYLKKGKYPYFVKLINNEILHIISYRHISSSTVGHKAMEIHGGAISLYRREIDLTDEPTYFLPQIHSYYNGEYNKLAVDLIRYECNMSDNESLTKDMKRAAELVREFILSNIENIVDIDSYVKYAKRFYFIDTDLCELDEYENNPREDYNESYLLVLTHDDDDGIKRMEDYIASRLEGMRPQRREMFKDKIIEESQNTRLYRIALRDCLINDKELFKRVEEILHTNKANNLEMLKGYGIIESQNEKKLTLKAAFIKVFGEALEPLGFVKAKSKYPYYVRVLNDEILHVITFRKDSVYKNRYDVYAGIATVYRPLLDFDRDPDFNTKWMSPIMAFEDYKVESPVLGIYYEYDLNSQTTLIQTLSKSIKHTQEYVLPVLDAVSDLQRVIDYYAIYNSAALYIYSAKDMSEYNRDDNEGLLYILINDHSDMRSEYEKSLERDKYLTENGLSNFDFERLREVAEESRKENLMNRDAIYNDKKLYEKVIQELSHNKETNIKRLIKYGFNISS